MAKGKKAKSPGKGKKGKDGGKVKSGIKASSPGKALAPTPSQEQSSTQQLTAGSTQDITAGSTSSLIPGQSETSAPPLGQFKPLNRPMLAPLVLPSDRSLSLTRRPSPIIVRDWGDVWFFPASVLALAIVVLGMIALTLHMKAEEMSGQLENNTTSVSNETAASKEESISSIGPTQSMTFSEPRRTKGTSEPELSSSMATSEQEGPVTGADVEPTVWMATSEQEQSVKSGGMESTAHALPMGTEDFTMTAIIVEEDNKMVISGFSGRSSGGRNMSSDEELAKNSPDHP